MVGRCDHITIEVSKLIFSVTFFKVVDALMTHAPLTGYNCHIDSQIHSCALRNGECDYFSPARMPVLLRKQQLLSLEHPVNPQEYQFQNFLQLEHLTYLLQLLPLPLSIMINLAVVALCELHKNYSIPSDQHIKLWLKVRNAR